MPIEARKGKIQVSQSELSSRSEKVVRFFLGEINGIESKNLTRLPHTRDLVDNLHKTLTSQWLFIGDPKIERIDREHKIVHADNFEDAVHGWFNSTTTYFGWSERYFSRPTFIIPDVVDKATWQLRLLDWWIGDGQGDQNTVTNQLKNIRDSHRIDLIHQIETTFTLAGEKQRTQNLARLRQTANWIDGLAVEVLSLESEKVFKPKGEDIRYGTYSRISITDFLNGTSLMTVEESPANQSSRFYSVDLTGQKTPLKALPRMIGNRLDLRIRKR